MCRPAFPNIKGHPAGAHLTCPNHGRRMPLPCCNIDPFTLCKHPGDEVLITGIGSATTPMREMW